MRIIQKFLLALLCALIVSISWGSICLAQTTIQLPTGKDMSNDPTVKQAIEDAWEDSRINSYDNRHEEGGWIYQNIETGELKVVRVAPGTRDEIEAPLPPPSEEGWRAVGFFHTHPSPPVDEKGFEWEQGPSDTDIETARKLGIPGIVRNRKGNEPFGPERGTYPPTQTTTLKPTDLTSTWRNPLSGQGLILERRVSDPKGEAGITAYYDVEWKITQSGNTVAGNMTLKLVKVSGAWAIDPAEVTPFKELSGRTGFVTGTVEGTGITIDFKWGEPPTPLKGSFLTDVMTCTVYTSPEEGVAWYEKVTPPYSDGVPRPNYLAPGYRAKLSLSRVR